MRQLQRIAKTGEQQFMENWILTNEIQPST
jgi:hypothetical protein